MKSRWWIAATLLLGLGLITQGGCGGAPDLPTEDTDTTSVDPEADMEVPAP